MINTFSIAFSIPPSDILQIMAIIWHDCNALLLNIQISIIHSATWCVCHCHIAAMIRQDNHSTSFILFYSQFIFLPHSLMSTHLQCADVRENEWNSHWQMSSRCICAGCWEGWRWLPSGIRKIINLYRWFSIKWKEKGKFALILYSSNVRIMLVTGWLTRLDLVPLPFVIPSVNTSRQLSTYCTHTLPSHSVEGKFFYFRFLSLFFTYFFPSSLYVLKFNL